LNKNEAFFVGYHVWCTEINFQGLCGPVQSKIIFEWYISVVVRRHNIYNKSVIVAHKLSCAFVANPL
jgi:hypothetical protein